LHAKVRVAIGVGRAVLQVQTLVAAGTTAICGTVSVGVGDAVDDIVGETVDDTINVTANSQSKRDKRKEWQVSGSVVVLSWQVCHQCATSAVFKKRKTYQLLKYFSSQ
jgi:hypothetical protein